MNDSFYELITRQWLTPGLSIVVALLLVVAAFHVGFVVLRRLTLAKPEASAFVRAAEGPGLAVAALVVLQPMLQTASDGLYGIGAARHAALLLFISAVTWLVARMISTVADAVALRFPIGVADNLNARRIQTQTRLITRTLASTAVLVGVGLGLLTFPGVRNIGASLLASAGIAGLVIGIAAKPILGNLLAGLQLALAQPIRMDDVVVVEGEWGRIEEIGSAYVVVALWDQRRLVLPLQYFIEKPFQNWTRTTSEILGAVSLWTDYGMPLEPLRAELRRICEASPLWDHRVAILQVTDASERALQLRALVSAADSARAWDLRCEVREGLVQFIRRDYPQCLPRLRTELGAEGGGSAPR